MLAQLIIVSAFALMIIIIGTIGMLVSLVSAPVMSFLTPVRRA